MNARENAFNADEMRRVTINRFEYYFLISTRFAAKQKKIYKSIQLNNINEDVSMQ